MAAIDIFKFSASLLLVMTGFRLVQQWTKDTPVGEALSFVFH